MFTQKHKQTCLRGCAMVKIYKQFLLNFEHMIFKSIEYLKLIIIIIMENKTFDDIHCNPQKTLAPY